jgi:uncharacterized membrane protein YdbT with pleckstrin-like domain
MIILRTNEKIYTIYRRHRAVLIIQLSLAAIFFLVIILPMIFLFFASIPPAPEWLVEIMPEVSNLNLRYLFLFFLSLLLPILWQTTFLVVVEYYLDCWILTNERIISAESLGLFNRKESSIAYDKIQDITVEIKGILPAFFHFGDLSIETASELGKFTFKQIPCPEKVKEVIMDIKEKSLKETKGDGVV